MRTLRAKPVSVLSSLVCERHIIFFTNFGLQNLRLPQLHSETPYPNLGEYREEKCLGLEPLFLSAMVMFFAYVEDWRHW